MKEIKYEIAKEISKWMSNQPPTRVFKATEDVMNIDDKHTLILAIYSWIDENYGLEEAEQIAEKIIKTKEGE